MENVYGPKWALIARAMFGPHKGSHIANLVKSRHQVLKANAQAGKKTPTRNRNPTAPRLIPLPLGPSLPQHTVESDNPLTALRHQMAPHPVTSTQEGSLVVPE